MSASDDRVGYRKSRCHVPELGLTLDVSRMRFAEALFERMATPLHNAFDAMEALEGGAIANPDEDRMVGHYWLRAPQRAPTVEIRTEIQAALARVKSLAAETHSGALRPPGAARFATTLSIGIGGSALGPMFLSDALGDPRSDRMRMRFMDNTDPDGIARLLAELDGRLSETLCLVISKSGGTPETRNGMRVVADAYRRAGLAFARHAIAGAGAGSRLDQQAQREGWLARLPMWDWVGGRTSVLSAAGLLPAALQGLDIDGLLAGAAACDEATRVRDARANPAALLALMWHHAGGGRGAKDMVILPYKDRLLLLSRYLQQLIMESLGKRLDLDGEVVEQGLAVYGNKGSTDQHAYVQQLRDGLNNFFVTFIRVLEAGADHLEVEPGVTSGDYLHAFLLGTREALSDSGRASLTITIPRVDARSVGALIALFERAVGLYARLININAYHQPGVEAGKRAASSILALQSRVLSALAGEPRSVEQLAADLGQPESAETIELLLEHLAANGRAQRGVDGKFRVGAAPSEAGIQGR